MGRQAFNDESNWKHEPHTKHYVDDKFEKGSTTRNWKKNVDETLEAKESDTDMSEEAQEESEKEAKKKKH